MRVLIVTDVHANAAALKAVLASPEAQRCDRVYSLGDEINFGPQPGEVLRLLHDADAQLLLGNHEERVAKAAEPAFQGYNWAMLHWTIAQLPGVRFDYPTDLRLGPVLLTHGTPGDPWHLVHHHDVPAVLDGLPGDVRYLISGHNHSCWCVTHGGRTAVNPGSLGMLEVEGCGSMAPFATLEISGDEAEIKVQRVPYDYRETLRAMLVNGCTAIAPELTRAVATVLRTGSPMFVTRLMRHVSAVGQPHGLTLGDREAWRLADPTFEWLEPGTTDEYWKRMERDLLG